MEPRTRFLATTGALALAAMASSPPAHAQSNQELMEIIRQQQRQIEELSRKVDVLQGQTEEASEKADAAAATAAQVEAAQDFEFSWGPAPTIRSKDGDFEVHLRGRLAATLIRCCAGRNRRTTRARTRSPRSR